MSEIINLSEYSDEELLLMTEAIKKETVKRTVRNFPYKIGDCFFRIAPSSMGRGMMICKIEDLDKAIKCKILNIDSCSNSWITSTYYTYTEFVNDWKTPIDSKVFDLHKELNRSINKLNVEFANQVIDLSDGKTNN